MSIFVHPLTKAELEATDEVIKVAYNETIPKWGQTERLVEMALTSCSE